MNRVTAKSNNNILVSRRRINIDIVLMLCSILKYVNKFLDDWIHLHFSAIFANGNDLRISIFSLYSEALLKLGLLTKQRLLVWE